MIAALAFIGLRRSWAKVIPETEFPIHCPPLEYGDGLLLYTGHRCACYRDSTQNRATRLKQNTCGDNTNPKDSDGPRKGGAPIYSGDIGW